MKDEGGRMRKREFFILHPSSFILTMRADIMLLTEDISLTLRATS
jgi:hypothetical protein